MKKNYFICIAILASLLSCSKNENIQKKDKELNDKIVQLQCGKSIQVIEVNYAYLIRNFRHNDSVIKFGLTYYHKTKKGQNVYVLVNDDKKNYSKEYLQITLDPIVKGGYGGISKTPFMKITKLCNN